MRCASAAAAAVALGFAAAASAVLIDSGDGTGNVTAPGPDPGWSHVGTRGGQTAVYLGDRFVLTANHVGAGNVVLAGVPYTFVPGTAVRLTNSDDASFADLLIFQIHPEPPLPPLELASGPPEIGTPLILIGRGRTRGPTTSWDPNGAPPPGPISGYEWGAGHAMRWGTNFIEDLPSDRVLNTDALQSNFDEGGSGDEAHATTGDSGGAAFAPAGGGPWELAGIVYAIGLFDGQPDETSLYGNATYSADLWAYRDEILDVIAMPEPSGALGCGAALTALLAARRRSRLPRGARSPAPRPPGDCAA